MPTLEPIAYAFTDIETTTSDPEQPYSHILEIGIVLCDRTPELNIIAEANIVIRPPGGMEYHDKVWAAMDPVVREMHSASGLWRDATIPGGTWDLTDADGALATWVYDKVCPGDSPFSVTIAGSGVSHFDFPWIKLDMPRIAAHMDYAPLDVGQVRRGLVAAGRADLVNRAGHVDGKPHRGLGDARLHRLEMLHYITLLGSITLPSPL